MNLSEQDPAEEFFANWRAADESSPVPELEDMLPKATHKAARTRWRWPLAVAASVLLGVFLTVMWSSGPTEPEGLSEASSATEGSLMSWESPTDELLQDY